MSDTKDTVQDAPNVEAPATAPSRCYRTTSRRRFVSTRPPRTENNH